MESEPEINFSDYAELADLRDWPVYICPEGHRIVFSKVVEFAGGYDGSQS